MVRAILEYHDKALLPDGGIVEMKIWRLPAASVERAHGLKYSLYFGKGGQRIVGYDNEAGKGDHRHLGPREEVYEFTTVEALIADFLADVERAQKQKELDNDG
jgi:Family of unknown function (DUF6516)